MTEGMFYIQVWNLYFVNGKEAGLWIVVFIIGMLADFTKPTCQLRQLYSERLKCCLRQDKDTHARNSYPIPMLDPAHHS